MLNTTSPYGLSRIIKYRFIYRELVLDAGDVEEGLDLLPQLPPGPGAELQVLAQVALDNLEGYPVGRGKRFISGVLGKSY